LVLEGGRALAGDAAFTVFHMADLDAVFGDLGARGYRVVQLAAGVAAERLGLAAVALGCGARGMTFFDDEVAQFLSKPASCLLATVVGLPTYRSRPGGRPRKPAELAGLMQPRVRQRRSLRSRAIGAPRAVHERVRRRLGDGTTRAYETPFGWIRSTRSIVHTRRSSE
jgi:hypothetical protein